MCLWYFFWNIYPRKDWWQWENRALQQSGDCGAAGTRNVSKQQQCTSPAVTSWHHETNYRWEETEVPLQQSRDCGAQHSSVQIFKKKRGKLAWAWTYASILVFSSRLFTDVMMNQRVSELLPGSASGLRFDVKEPQNFLLSSVHTRTFRLTHLWSWWIWWQRDCCLFQVESQRSPPPLKPINYWTAPIRRFHLLPGEKLESTCGLFIWVSSWTAKHSLGIRTPGRRF